MTDGTSTEHLAELPAGSSADAVSHGGGVDGGGDGRSTSPLRYLLRRLDRYKHISGLIGALVALWILLSILSQYFLTLSNFYNILLQASNLAIVSAGLTLVILVGEIDLSVGSVEAFAGAVAAILIIKTGIPVVPGVILSLLAAALIGLINAFLTTKLRVVSFIATLAMLGVAQGIAFIMTDGQAIEGFPQSFQNIGTATIGQAGFPVPAVIAIVVIVLIYVLLTRTKLGLHMFAVGGSRQAATYAGISPARIKTIAFVICAVTSGIGGLILSGRLNAGNGLFGQGDLLNAVAAVVIGGASLSGGMGSIAGTTVGVLIIATIEDGLVLLDVPDFWQQVVVGAFIVGAVMMDQIAKGISRTDE
jgi:ribose/xylose/arabinose/galactoside ABC-type transport system permease subunit